MCVSEGVCALLFCAHVFECVYVWHRWKDFSGITVELEEERGGNCILITVLIVLCSARWKVLYRYKHKINQLAGK